MDTQATVQAIRDNVKSVFIGKGDAIDLTLTALLCGGHVLIEDVPGVGKTTLVWALANSIGCSFKRIQFTPDVLPSDITGFTLYDMQTNEKSFVQGAVMSQVVLADEINRTSPKTQSALLEVMQEGQVTVDGETHPLPSPFIVLATQNPIGLIGTYPLPEAQLDRFLLCVHLGYPDMEDEIRILSGNRSGADVRKLEPVADANAILELREAVQAVTCSTAVEQYIVRITRATRENKDISLGASPRAAIALMQASMAWAFLQGRTYVLPDDVQRMAEPVLAHRLVLNTQAGYNALTAQKVISTLLGGIRVPIVS